MTRQSTREALSDLVRKTGHEPKGRTTASLIDEFEDHYGGGGGSVDPESLRSAIESYLEHNTGGLTDEEISEIFGQPYVPGGGSGGIETGGLTDEEIDALFGD